MSKMPLPNLTFLRDDFRMTTWLLTGAALQCLLFLVLPKYVALLPSLLLVAARVGTAGLVSYGILRDPTFDRVKIGRFTAQIPHEDGSAPQKAAEKEVVILVLGARSNHPKGRFAPGYVEVGHLFRRMWQDAAKNREKWGYLGKSSTLLATDEEAGNTMIWLSYWKDIDHLRAYAHGDAHRAGWDWWNAFKGHPHIGIMHEIYSAPKGNWENIYHNFTPFGMGQTKHFVKDNEKEGNEDSGRLISPLQAARGATWKSMITRMGRVEIS